MSGLLSKNSAERNMIERGYMERMGKDFEKVVVGTAEINCITPEELYLQHGNRPFWHELTVILNEEMQFDGARMELDDLTQAEVKFLIRKHFSRILRKSDWTPAKGAN